MDHMGKAQIAPVMCRIMIAFVCFSFARGVAFESESDLREKGAYKTPDMLLQVPMAVKGPSNEVGFVAATAMVVPWNCFW